MNFKTNCFKKIKKTIEDDSTGLNIHGVRVCEGMTEKMTQPEIRVVSTTMVHTTGRFNDPTQQSRIELTPWDLFMLPVNYNQKGLLYHKPTQQSNYLDLLKTSLSRTLDYFYPVAGRLSIETHKDNTKSVFIDCNNAGAEFVHAMVDLTIADIVNPTYTPYIINSFFPLNGATNYQGLTDPLLVVQVNELTDGIFIAFTANHVVVDGAAFWHFINSWSEICRGLDHISSLPHLKRCFINCCDPPIRLPLFDPEVVHKKFTQNLELDQRVFTFAPQHIALLKAKANAECETNQVSSLQALFAHLWIAVTRAYNLDPNQETNYRMMTGNRTRLIPNLPDNYFGNSVCVTTATAKVGNLLERGTGWAALLMNQTIASHNDTVIREAWDSWLKQPTWPSPGSFTSHDLHAGSSPRFNVYGTDFGWGRPIAVRSGCANKSEGKITVFPGRVDGSIDIEACFPMHALKAMENDKEFMELITILPPM